MKLHAATGWNDFWWRHHMVNKERYIATFTKTAITKLGWNTYANKIIPFLYVTWFIIIWFLYSYKSFLYVTWSCNLLKLPSVTSKKTITTKFGWNIYKSEMVAFLHMTWPNQAKVVKATAPKIALIKGTHLNRPHDFLLCDILTNEKSICNFYKTC